MARLKRSRRSVDVDRGNHDAPYHFILPGVPRAPVGGFKIAFDYANTLIELGHPVTLWYSTAYFKETAPAARLQPLRASVHWLRHRRTEPLVDWYPIDERVSQVVSPGYARPRLSASDVVVATAVQTMPHSAHLARRSGATSLALIQHYETWSASSDYIARAWAAPDARIVIAPWLADRCASLGLESYTLPNAVDPSEFPLGPDLVDRKPSVLSLLSSHAFKRPDLLRDVFARIHSLRPDVALTAFGQERRPSELPEYVAYVHDPPRARLVELYQSTRVYLCVSDAEGWHLPPAEATLAGAGVVSTDIGGVRASMEGDALFAPLGDASALTSQVLASLTEDERSQKLARQARARLLARSIESNAAELVSVAVAARRTYP